MRPRNHSFAGTTTSEATVGPLVVANPGSAASSRAGNGVAGCRYPGLSCDRLCTECRGDFDVIDAKTGRRVGDVDGATAMARLLAEFGEQK